MEPDETIETNIDRFASVGALTAAHLELQAEYTQAPQDAEMIGKIEAFLAKGTATGTLLDHPDDRQVCQSLLDYWVTTLYSLGVEDVHGALLEFDPNTAPMLPDEPCPYLGLGEFQEQDASKFFGRKHLVEHMVKCLTPRSDRMLLVIGPSGAGKSSVVKAGLLPALKANAIEGSSGWFFHESIVPGESPNRNLQVCLDQAEAGGSVQVFVIDQFEELFTLCQDVEKRETFANKLGALADDGHAIIITLRSDFEPYLTKLPALEERVENTRVAVNSLSAPDLRRAIEEPAKEVGLKFEKGVVDRLVQDLVGEPAGLPLLQFTLMKLWENRQRNRITMDAYKELGGGRLALARSADAIYDEFIPEECTTAKRLFLRLVQPGEGLEVTRKRVAIEDLYRAGEAKDRVDRVLDKFISARLIRRIEATDDKPVQLEVIHEALVRNWPKLTEWLDSARNRLRQNAKLTTAAEDWQREGRKEAFLFRGDQLAEVEVSTRGFEEELGPDELAFLKASRKLRDAERRKEERGKLVMLGLIGAGISMVAITILAVKAYSLFLESESNLETANRAKEAEIKQTAFAENQWAIAREQKKLAEEAFYLRGKTFLQQARFNKDQNNYFASAMMSAKGLGFRGFGIDDQAKEDAAPEVDKVLTEYPVLIPEKTDPSLHKELEGLVRSNLMTGFPIWQSPTTNHHLAAVTGVACHPDANQLWLVSCSPDKTIKLWDMGDGKELAASAENESDLLCVAFGEGDLIASGDAAGTIQLWNIERDGDKTPTFVKQQPLLGHKSAVVSLSFTEDNMLESRSEEAVKRWDLKEMKDDSTSPLDAETAVSGIRAVSPDGQQEAKVDPLTGKIVVIELAGGATKCEMQHPYGVRSLAFSADGKILVSGGDDRMIRLWKLDSESGAPINPVPSGGHIAGISKLAFHPNGHLASQGSDMSVHFWEASKEREITESVKSKVNCFAWGRDAESGEEVRVMGDNEGRVLLWDPATNGWEELVDNTEDAGNGTPPPAAGADEDGPPEPISLAVTLLDISPDGRRAISYGGDHKIKLWNLADKALESQSPVLYKAALSLKFSAEGMLILNGGDQSIRLWDVDALGDKPLLELSGHFTQGEVKSLAVSPRGRLFATASGKTVRLWDLVLLGMGATKPTLGSASAPIEHNAEVTAIAFRNDGGVLASSAADGSVKLWRIGEDSATLVGAFSAHQSGVDTMAFSPSGDYLAVGSLGDSSVKLWYVGDGAESEQKRDLAAYLIDGWCELEGRNVIFPPATNDKLFSVRKFEASDIPPRSSPPAAETLLVDLVEADSVRSLRASSQQPITTLRTQMRMIWVETIDGWVGETEVTQAQFAKGGGADHATSKGLNRPVEKMTLEETLQFCEELTASEKEIGNLPDGYCYTLPTEKQWLNYVADSGLDHAVYSQNETADVKTKPANIHGLYDVRGNVWELTLTQHPNKPGRIVRGGGFDSKPAAVVGPDYQQFLRPGGRHDRYGFRCVLVRKKTE